MTPLSPSPELRLPFDDGFARGFLIYCRRAASYAIVLAANILVLGIFFIAVNGLKVPPSVVQYVQPVSLGLSVAFAVGSLLLLWRMEVRFRKKFSTPVEPSPLVYFDYAVAENLLRFPIQTPIYRLRQSGDSEAVFRAPRLSPSSDAVEMLVDIYERGVKIFEGKTPAVTIDLFTGAVRIVEGAESGRHGLTLDAHANRVNELFAKLPEALTRLPDLIIGSLIPLAHYLSGLETSRRLRDANQKLDTLLAGRRIDQQALLEHIWLRAGEIGHSPDDPQARTTLLQFRDELLRLRLTWENEIGFLLQTAPDVVAAWRKNRKAWEVLEHVLPCVEKLRLLQLAVFADYCLSIATGTTGTFLDVIIPSEIQKVKRLTKAFESQQSILENLDAYAEIAQIADTMQAYYEFLQQLAALSKQNIGSRRLR